MLHSLINHINYALIDNKARSKEEGEGINNSRRRKRGRNKRRKGENERGKEKGEEDGGKGIRERRNKYGSSEFDQISNKICDNRRKFFVIEGRQWFVQKVEVGQNGREDAGEHGGNPGWEIRQIIHNIDEVIDDGSESVFNIVWINEFLLEELFDKFGGKFDIFVFLREESKDIFHQQVSFLVGRFRRKNVKFGQINFPTRVNLFHEDE